MEEVSNKVVSFDTVFRSFLKWLFSKINLTRKSKSATKKEKRELVPATVLYSESYYADAASTASLFNSSDIKQRELTQSNNNPTYRTVRPDVFATDRNDSMVKEFIDDKGTITTLTVGQLKKLGIIKNHLR